MKSNYNTLSEYYKNKFHERVLKICVDGNFSCPNRDGMKSTGGCIFCSGKGSGDLIKNQDIKTQITSFLDSYRGQRANKFIVYFQSFSNTYRPVEELKKIYDSALIDERIIGLDVATRCDCINEDVCKLLSSYKDKYHVMVELGLQSAKEETHVKTNQTITNNQFIEAVKLLNKYDIEVIIHIMIGLPGENHFDVVNTINFLNTLNYQGLKIHSTYVLKDTALELLYQRGLYKPLEEQEYIEEIGFIIGKLDPRIIIHRITGDPPKELLVAPNWCKRKTNLLNKINKYLWDNNIKQGDNYLNSPNLTTY